MSDQSIITPPADAPLPWNRFGDTLAMSLGASKAGKNGVVAEFRNPAALDYAVAAANALPGLATACELLIRWRDHPISGSVSKHSALLHAAVESASAALAALPKEVRGE